MRFCISRPSFPRWAQVGIISVLLLILAALWAPLLAPYLPPPGTLETLDSDGDAREYYLFIPPGLPASQPVPLVVMLQGFDSPDAPSGATRSLYRAIAAAARRHSFMAVFPRGMKGSFPDVPDVRAWCPEYFQKNRGFLVRLVSFLKRQHPIDARRVILAGFSNGAYFASTELTARPDTPFTGFWLDGGGYPYAFRPDVKRHPAFLTWGAHDIYNASNTIELAEFLAGHGWRPDTDLRSESHPWAHVFNDDAVDRAVDFLLNPRRERPEVPRKLPGL